MNDDPQKNDELSEPPRLSDTLRRMGDQFDRRREPQFLSAQQGRRQISIQALIERIIAQFMAEHGERESDAVQQAVSEMDRIKLVKASADYVIAVESVDLNATERADITRRVYAEMFAYGPLDALFNDPNVTTITLEGSEKAAVRYGHGELTTIPPLFEDEAHLKRIIRRLLEDAGASFRPDAPIIETGLTVNGRRVGLSVILPPATILLSVDLRVHPLESLTLADMVKRGVMPGSAADLLGKIAASAHGVVIVGEPESGKTSLLGAMLAGLSGRIVAIERAGEMALPDEAERLMVQWPVDERAGVGFAEQVRVALERDADVIALDEIRADEASAVAPLLMDDDVPRQMWVFRGPADSKRLISALGMLARRAAPAAGESAVRRMYERLPFVVTLRRRKGKLTLHSIAEWQFAPSAEYPDFVELMAMGWDGLEPTGAESKNILE